MDVLKYNGGIVMAIKGKNCVAIASDKRLGVQFQTVSTNHSKIYEMRDGLYIGLPGLATDTETVAKKLKFRLNMYELREGRPMKPKTFAAMVSNMLYERRFSPYFIEPVIAGIDTRTGEPFIGSMDLIGCMNSPSDFAVAGTCDEQAFGMLELLCKPDLEPDDLFENISQSLMNAFDRDAISGWGGVVYIIEKDKVTIKTLKTRMD